MTNKNIIKIRPETHKSNISDDNEDNKSLRPVPELRAGLKNLLEKTQAPEAFTVEVVKQTFETED